MKPALFALLLLAAPSETVLLSVHGKLIAETPGVPPDAQFVLTPTAAHTAVEVGNDGAFVVKAVSARSYSVDVYASGYAPIHRVVDIDARGVANVGTLKLEALKRARATAVVGPRETLKQAPAQELDLSHGSCASVRAQDNSGCAFQLCVTQSGSTLQANRWVNGGSLVPLGKVSLEDALTKEPSGGTYVTGGDTSVPLRAGETVRVQLSDAYCGALLHIESESPAAATTQ
jgi:hypothetical protein